MSEDNPKPTRRARATETRLGLTVAERFGRLFKGLDRAHGVYNPKQSKKGPTGKLEGGQFTAEGPATIELLERHLSGALGLGAYPLRDDGLCNFGAIDVDVYPSDIESISKKISEEKFQFPLIPCKTKSGGVHLYVFISGDGAPADIIQQQLKKWAAALGVTSKDKNTGKDRELEIFPVQTTLVGKSLGNYINLPYFGGDKGDRYAVVRGKRATMEQFLTIAETYRLSAADLKHWYASDTDKVSKTKDKWWIKAPPGLVELTANGSKVSQGGQNIFLFNTGIYLKRNNRLEELDKYNEQFCEPRYPSEKFNGLKKRIAELELVKPSKDDEDSWDEIPTLLQLYSPQRPDSIWTVTFNGYTPFKLTSGEILNQKAWREAMANEIRKVPRLLSLKQWDLFINRLLESSTREVLPEADTASGGIWSAVLDACRNLVTTDKDQVNRKGVYHDLNKKLYKARLETLQDYLDTTKRIEVKKSTLADLIKKKGGLYHPYTASDGKTNIAAWDIPMVDELKLREPTPEEDI